MRIAIPVAAGKLAMHFGHCEEFAFVDVDAAEEKITGTETLQPPAHQPGVLPVWLAEQGADVIIAGGMGMRAQQLFADHKIEVVVGAPVEDPNAIASAYIDGTLETGGNICDH